jgi:hypothetical protein
MNFSIRTKLLLISGLSFLMLAAMVILVSNFMIGSIIRESEKVVDDSTNALFTEKVRSLFDCLEKQYTSLQATLKETGLAGTHMAKTYEDDAKTEIIKALSSLYYAQGKAKDAKSSPFLIDEQGVIILHPSLPQGDKSVTGLPFIQKMLAQDQGTMQYEYKQEKKWMFFKKFAPWKWTVGYIIPENVKYAGVNNISSLLLSLRNRLGFIVAIMAVIATLILGGYITWKIVRPINRVILGINDGSESVVEAASQTAETNHSIAQGASEQAAAIEETSSACEEMDAMSRQNADNAHQANILMEATNQVVVQANNSMTELTTSMQEISTASSETAKIIKTIDEIAFQTNLLALNAAVEAARAGEAGAGFAVVADEVRSLAMRAAEAARNTAALIEKTVTKVKDGSNLVSKTAEDFSQVNSNAAKVKGLVAEITAASNEQAQGIEQINKTVAEMDKVVQQNAAHAQEGASASEQLSNEAREMKGRVLELVKLVGGNGHAGSEEEASTKGHGQSLSLGTGRVSGEKISQIIAGKTLD